MFSSMNASYGLGMTGIVTSLLLAVKLIKAPKEASGAQVSGSCHHRRP